MKNVILLFSFLLAFNLCVKADSPLTSTVFYKAYLSIPEVKKASESEILTAEMMSFLSNKDNKAVHKLALVNALSWGDTVKTTTYESFLFEKYPALDKEVFNELRVYKDSVIETPSIKMLTSDELMVWSSLQINGDYFNPIKGGNAAIIIIRKHRKEKSQAHVLPLTLILCQIYMDDRDKWCDIYNTFVSYVIQTEYSEGLFSEEALIQMLDYIGLYKGSCSE